MLNQLALSADGIEGLPVLIVGISREPTSLAALSTLIERENVEGDGHRTLGPLGSDAVVEIARLYIEDPTDLPFDAMLRASGGLPGRLHELVVAWARDEANRRVEAAAEWLTAGRGELRRTELRLANNAIGLKLARLYAADAAGTIAGGGSPYLGLASFGADDASYFFGRERLVGELAARLVGTGMLGLVGASGSGKSSVVAAGLLPSLTAGLLPGSERWRQAGMRPGEHPMSALDIALEEKGGDPGTLTQVIDRLGPTGRLILVVDQFEEIFTACADEEERSAFVEALTTAASSAPERLGVVVAIRGDLYERCSAYPALAELLGSTQVLVGPMTPDELRRALTPAVAPACAWSRRSPTLSSKRSPTSRGPPPALHSVVRAVASSTGRMAPAGRLRGDGRCDGCRRPPGGGRLRRARSRGGRKRPRRSSSAWPDKERTREWCVAGHRSPSSTWIRTPRWNGR